MRHAAKSVEIHYIKSCNKYFSYEQEIVFAVAEIHLFMAQHT